MTDVTTDNGQAPVELSAADEQVLRELTERARTGGLKLTGEGGLLGKLTKMVVEGALEGELDDHLGYEKNDPAGRNGSNSRNGYRAKTVITDTGPVEITVPRDRDSSFEPRIVAKRQRRLTGVDDMVISLSAKGLTHGEISAHLAEVYGAEVSKQTITTITDRVMEGMAEWQNRPLDAGGSSDGRELASSTGDEQCSHGFLGGLVGEGEPWSVVEFVSDLLQILGGVDREVGVFREVLADQAVGVLVEAPLPRGVGVAEVHVEAGRGGVCSCIDISRP